MYSISFTIELPKDTKNAIIRAITGAISKDFSKTEKLRQYLLAEALQFAIQQNLNLKMGDLIKIDYDFIDDGGIITGFKTVLLRLYRQVEDAQLKEIKITDDAISRFVEIKTYGEKRNKK